MPTGAITPGRNPLLRLAVITAEFHGTVPGEVAASFPIILWHPWEWDSTIYDSKYALPWYTFRWKEWQEKYNLLPVADRQLSRSAL